MRARPQPPPSGRANATQNASPTVLNTYPPLASDRFAHDPSRAATASCIAERSRSQRCVLPSISLKRKVTVPDGVGFVAPAPRSMIRERSVAARPFPFATRVRAAKAASGAPKNQAVVNVRLFRRALPYAEGSPRRAGGWGFSARKGAASGSAACCCGNAGRCTKIVNPLTPPSRLRSRRAPACRRRRDSRGRVRRARAGAVGRVGRSPALPAGRQDVVGAADGRPWRRLAGARAGETDRRALPELRLATERHAGVSAAVRRHRRCRAHDGQPDDGHGRDREADAAARYASVAFSAPGSAASGLVFAGYGITDDELEVRRLRRARRQGQDRCHAAQGSPGLRTWPALRRTAPRSTRA